MDPRLEQILNRTLPAWGDLTTSAFKEDIKYIKSVIKEQQSVIKEQQIKIDNLKYVDMYKEPPKKKTIELNSPTFLQMFGVNERQMRSVVKGIRSSLRSNETSI